jgi:hypothetical protein
MHRRVPIVAERQIAKLQLRIHDYPIDHHTAAHSTIAAAAAIVTRAEADMRSSEGVMRPAGCASPGS